MFAIEQITSKNQPLPELPEPVLMTFTSFDDEHPEKSYRLIITWNGKFPTVSDIEAMVKDPNLPETFDHYTELCLECPILLHGTDEQMKEKMKYELLAGILLMEIKNSYKKKEPVYEEIKNAYRYCVQQLHHCEPLETQIPIF